MSVQCENTSKKNNRKKIGFFEHYLTLWVFICIVVGIALGHWLPAPFQTLAGYEVAEVNLPVAILIWLMIIPMLLKIDFKALSHVKEHWRGVSVTLFPWLFLPGFLFVVSFQTGYLQSKLTVMLRVLFY